MKYQFIVDYLSEGYSKVPEDSMIPTRFLTWQFYKGDIFEGIDISNSDVESIVEFEIEGKWLDYSGIGIFKVPMKILQIPVEIIPPSDDVLDPPILPDVTPVIYPDTMPPVHAPSEITPVDVPLKKKEFFLIRFLKWIFGAK